MLPKDYALNIQRSLYKWMYEKLSANYYVNYSNSGDETLEQRIRDRVVGPPPYWEWIDINWVKIGATIFSVCFVQINCCTIIASDPYRAELMKMHDETQEELNVNTIPLLDFSNDPNNPEPTNNVLIPRYRGSRPLAEAAGGTVNVEALDYNIYVWRESVLP